MIFTQLFQSFAAGCTTSGFFGIPPWYKYLVVAGRMETKTDPVIGQYCDLKSVSSFADRTQDLILVAMGILDIVLRLAGMVAVGFVIYGGILYMTSDGDPSRTKDAQQTIINALVGLVIAIIATALVSFIGNRLG